MNNGETPKPCEKISKLLPAGKSTSLTFPTKINCLVPGTRCIHIRYVDSIQFLVEHQFFCIFFFLFSCPAFSLLDSKSDVATVKIMLEFQGDSLNNFQLPDTVDDGSEGIMIGTKGKIIVPDDLQDLIEEDNIEDDEVFSYTEVICFSSYIF